MSNAAKKEEVKVEVPVKQPSRLRRTWRFIKETNMHWMLLLILAIGGFNAGYAYLDYKYNGVVPSIVWPVM